MRAYTVATAAVALRVTTKWVDNVLSHHTIPGVSQSRQGIARRLTEEAVGVLEIALRLTRNFEIPLRKALALAIVPSAESRREVEACELRIDVAAIRAELDIRLADAVEFSPVPPRGRPRGR